MEENEIFEDENAATAPLDEQEPAFEDAPPPSPRYSEGQANMTSALAAFGQIANGMSDENFPVLRGQQKALLEAQQEAYIRALMGDARKKKQLAISGSTVDQLVEDQDLVQGIADVLEREQAIREQAPDYNALEIEGIDALQNMGLMDDEDHKAAQLLKLEKDGGTSLDAIRDNMIKSSLLQRELDVYIQETAGAPIKGVRNHLSWFLMPFSELKVTFGEGESLFQLPGDRLKKKIENFYALPVDEFIAQLPQVMEEIKANSGFVGENSAIARDVLRKYAEGTLSPVDTLFYNGSNLFDVATLGAGAVVKAGKATTVSRMGQELGARHMVVNKQAATLLASREAKIAGEETVEAASDLIPSAAKMDDPLRDPTDVGISGELRRRLTEMDAIAARLTDLRTPNRLTEDEVAELITRTEKEIRDAMPAEHIADIRRVRDPLSQTTTVQTLLGKADGTAYLTKEAAQKAIERHGLKAEVEEAADGRFWVRQDTPVRELTASGGLRLSAPGISSPTYVPTGPMASMFRSLDNLTPELHTGMRHMSEMTEQAFETAIIAPLARPIRKLGKDSKTALQTVMIKGQKDQVWYWPDEFVDEFNKTTGRDPSIDEVEAYYAAKTLNDVDHAIHNNKLYTDLSRRGAESMDITLRGTGVPSLKDATGFVWKGNDLSRLRVYDSEKGALVNMAKAQPEVVADAQRKLSEGTHMIVQTLETVRKGTDPMTHFLVPVGDVTRKALRKDLLPYVGGGHRIYRTKWFAKQANKGTYSDGDTYLLSPHVLSTFRTEKQATDWVNGINKALADYRAYRSVVNNLPAGGKPSPKLKAQLRTAIADSPFGSLAKLEKMLDEGRIGLNEDVEVLFDRVRPKEYDLNTSAADLWRLTDEAIDDTYQNLRDSGRLYYGHKGEGLPSPLDDSLILVDPLNSVHQGVRHAARTFAWGSYITRAQEDWVRLAMPYIDKTSLPSGASAAQVFHEGKLQKSLFARDPKLFRILDENRKYLWETMGVQTEAQKMFEHAARDIARSVEDNFNAVGLGDLGTDLVMRGQFLKDSNPIAIIKGAIFDPMLGMFDLSQLVIQTQTMLAALSLSPSHGAKAISVLWPTRLAVINGTDNMLDYVAKKTAKLHGMPEDEYKTMVREYRKSGWNTPGKELTQLAHNSVSIGDTKAGFYASELRHASRVFFNEAERLNRITAWNIAWQEAKAAKPGLAIGSDEFLVEVNRLTSNYSMNMTQASAAGIQKAPLTSLATQFLGYQMRMLEAILPTRFGGSRQWTAAQKARLAAGQILLYGGAGVPAGGIVAQMVRDSYQKTTGEEMPLVAAKAVESGMIDTFLLALSGGELNTDLSKRTGSGRGWDDLIKKMGEGRLASFLDIATGPAGSYTGGYGESIGRVMRYFKAEQSDELTQEDVEYVFNELVTNHISSLSRAQRATWIWRYGQVLDKKTRQPKFNATKLEAMAAAIGIPLWEESERQRIYTQLVKRDEEVRAIGQQVAQLRRMEMEALLNGDDKRAGIIGRQAAALLQPYRDDPLLQQQIAIFAERNLGDETDQWVDIVEQRRKRLGRETPNVEDQQ